MTARNPFTHTARGYKFRFWRSVHTLPPGAMCVNMSVPKNHWFFDYSQPGDFWADEPEYVIRTHEDDKMLDIEYETNNACKVPVSGYLPHKEEIGWFVEGTDMDAIDSVNRMACWLDDPKSENDWGRLIHGPSEKS